MHYYIEFVCFHQTFNITFIFCCYLFVILYFKTFLSEIEKIPFLFKFTEKAQKDEASYVRLAERKSISIFHTAE